MSAKEELILNDKFWEKEFYSAADIGKILGVHFSKVWRIVGAGYLLPPPDIEGRDRKKWTYDEMIVALDFYSKSSKKDVIFDGVEDVKVYPTDYRVDSMSWDRLIQFMTIANDGEKIANNIRERIAELDRKRKDRALQRTIPEWRGLRSGRIIPRKGLTEQEWKAKILESVKQRIEEEKVIKRRNMRGRMPDGKMCKITWDSNGKKIIAEERPGSPPA